MDSKAAGRLSMGISQTVHDLEKPNVVTHLPLIRFYMQSKTADVFAGWLKNFRVLPVVYVRNYQK